MSLLPFVHVVFVPHGLADHRLVLRGRVQPRFHAVLLFEPLVLGGNGRLDLLVLSSVPLTHPPRDGHRQLEDGLHHLRLLPIGPAQPSASPVVAARLPSRAHRFRAAIRRRASSSSMTCATSCSS